MSDASRDKTSGQQGALDRCAPPLRRLAKLSPTLEACGIKRRAHPNKTLLHCAPFLMREFVALSCGFLPPPTTLKGMSLAKRGK